MKIYGGVEMYLQLHHSLPRHSMEASGQLHSPVALPLDKNLGTQWIEAVWV
jgi:hypothetical protein